MGVAVQEQHRGPRSFVHVVDGVPVDGDEAALEWEQLVVDPRRSSRVSHDCLQESWRQAVGGAQHEAKRPSEERDKRAGQTSAAPGRYSRRERREQRREARQRPAEDLELNDLPLLVEAREHDGFEFHPANVRAKCERSRIAERERFGGVEILKDGEDIAVQVLRPRPCPRTVLAM